MKHKKSKISSISVRFVLNSQWKLLEVMNESNFAEIQIHARVPNSSIAMSSHLMTSMAIEFIQETLWTNYNNFVSTCISPRFNMSTTDIRWISFISNQNPIFESKNRSRSFKWPVNGKHRIYRYARPPIWILPSVTTRGKCQRVLLCSSPNLIGLGMNSPTNI